MQRAQQGPTVSRRLPVGAEAAPDGGVHFRVWAPRRQRVAVVLEDGPGAARFERAGTGAPPPEFPLGAEEGGYFSGAVPAAGHGSRYRFRLDGEDYLYPDPASRWQPDGPHGPSEVVDPARFAWTDAGWPGVDPATAVIYEMHVGTFTREGTWAAAARELPALADLGVTVLEVMPVAEFPGRFGWGYDGVDLYAPTRLYGTPDDLRRFVAAAHAAGLGVILDVVYNHLGPDGNYLTQFAAAYFTARYANEWGEAINFDGPDAGPVREFYAANAGYWIDEYHLDGLRLDATQCIYDSSRDNILAEIGRRVRAAARGRPTLIVSENEPQDTRLVRPPAQGGYALDALWNDDFHHSAMVALAGRNDAYYTDYKGTAQEFVSAARHGYLYQGQFFTWQRKPRGTPGLDLDPLAFVNFIQNHDQVANSARGLRVHALTSPGRLRAMTALLLLMPGIPMLFQGQEFAASAPFLYFADHGPELAALVRKGRAEFLAQFPALATPALQPVFAPPDARATFERCRLDLAERERPGHAEAYALHRDLLRLRRDDPTLRPRRGRRLDGAVLGDEALVLRYFGDPGDPGDPGCDDRLLLVNLGRTLPCHSAPEPLLAPPYGRRWALLWSSEDPRYGGDGTAPPAADENWRIPGHAALVLAPLSVAATAPEED